MCLREAPSWCSSFAKCRRELIEMLEPILNGLATQVGSVDTEEQLMKNDLENKTGVPTLVSRRQFILAAAATGGAGILSAGLGPITAHASFDKAAEFVLPTATKDVTPFKVHVPPAPLDDLKERLANARWPDKETVTDWSQGVPLAKAH